MSNQIRVLQIVPSLSRAAGVARFVYNMERYHDESRVHYDFLHHAIRNGEYMHEKRYDEELERHGSSIYTVNYAGDGLARFMHEVHGLFEDVGSSYDVIHCHMPNSAFSTLREAKRAGVSCRVLHSHLNSSSDKLLHRLRNVPLNAIGLRYATDLLACSSDAGRYLFGSRHFTVINNGIPLEEFSFRADLRQRLRDELGIGSADPVIGCVGRFVQQKNYPFAVRVFSRLLKDLPNAKLIILGDGDGREPINKAIADEGIERSVRLPGVREDVNEFYSAFDVLLMPSLYEGLPVSAIEAQASGLPCVFSVGVPHEVDLTGGNAFVPLRDGVGTWASALLSALDGGRIDDGEQLLEKRGYSAKENAELLMRHYESLVEGR